MIILFHSSKTMRPGAPHTSMLRAPQLLDKAILLDAYLKTLTPAEIAKAMHVSPALAGKTQQLIGSWNAEPTLQTRALDCFIGDMYSGLRAEELSASDQDYADQSLRILSGLYGVIRPFDGICPYRLEMGYKLPAPQFRNLYKYWGDSVAKTLPREGLIVNASSAEYTQTVTPFVDAKRVVAPTFLTVNPATGQPTFVVVHAKIARGAFAHWLITSRTAELKDFPAFNELGYTFKPSLSTPQNPTYICQKFGGLGLSIRLR